MNYKTRLQCFGIAGTFIFKIGVVLFLLAAIVFASLANLLTWVALGLVVTSCVFGLWSRFYNKKGLKNALSQLRQEYENKVISQEQEHLFNILADSLSEPSWGEVKGE